MCVKHSFFQTIKGNSIEKRCFDYRKEVPMKKEDMWLIIVVAFSIIWTMSFGWGIFG